jgi:hypothetical protein
MSEQPQPQPEWQELDASPAHESLSAEELREALLDASKLWLAHDGLWFLEWEKRHGIEEAMLADTEAWRQFARLEAARIMARLGLHPGGGVPALAACLRHRLYANICKFAMQQRGERELKLRMVECRVQDARARKGLPAFPCKCVGIVEFAVFAATVDPRFHTVCEQCPPDQRSAGGWCEWHFELLD